MLRWIRCHTTGPRPIYQEWTRSKRVAVDPKQAETVEILQTLHDQLMNYQTAFFDPLLEKKEAMSNVKDAGKSDLSSPDFAWIDQEATIYEKLGRRLYRVFQPRQEFKSVLGPKGMYIYGDVGTGKSMMMDLFHDTLPVKGKRRVHFHRFMQDVHQRIHHLKSTGVTTDPIPLVASELAHQAWLLCFDELQVTDIADAMILRRLLTELFNRGVVMVNLLI